MSDTSAILRDVYGQYAAKKIARRFTVSVATAKLWLAGRFPEARTKELAAVVREELEKIDARNKEIRKRLGIASEGNGHPEADGKTDSGIAFVDAVALGEDANRLGGEVSR